MIALSGNVVAGLSRDDQHKSCVETLKRAAEVIEGRQIEGQPVRLLLECIDPEENPKYYLQSAAEAIEVVRAVGHPQVQFLYDMFHEQIAEGNLMEKLLKNIDLIGLIHVADVPGRHEPGTGEINYLNIYRALLRLNTGMSWPWSSDRSAIRWQRCVPRGRWWPGQRPTPKRMLAAGFLGPSEPAIVAPLDKKLLFAK